MLQNSQRQAGCRGALTVSTMIGLAALTMGEASAGKVGEPMTATSMTAIAMTATAMTATAMTPEATAHEPSRSEVRASQAEAPARLAGRIEDDDGNPVYGVQVVIRSSEVRLQLVTDERGEFMQMFLKRGVYQLEYSKDGYQTRRMEVSCDSGVTTVDVVLPRIDMGVTTTHREIMTRIHSSGLEAFKAGDHAAARDRMQEFLSSVEDEGEEFDPARVSALSVVGASHLQLNQPDEAVAAYELALELRPDEASAHAGLGQAFLRLQEHDDAAAHFERAVALRSEDPALRFNLALSLLRGNRIDEGIEALEQVIELQPELAAAHKMLGYAYGQRGQRDRAVERLQIYLQLQPEAADRAEIEGIIRTMAQPG